MMLYDEKQYEKSSSSSDEDEDKKTATKKQKSDAKDYDDDNSSQSGKLIHKASLIDFSEFNNFIEFIISKDPSK